ncbi:MAG: YciI family protein [Rhizobiaceae bacterium]
MSEYIIAYLGGKKPDTPEQGAEHMAKWKAWLGGLGDAVVNPGTPLGASVIINSEGVSEDVRSDRLTGFSVVKAESLDAAVAIAKECPFLEMGTLEVAEIMQMS